MTAPDSAPSARTNRPRPRFQLPPYGLGGGPIGELPTPAGDEPAAATIHTAYGAGIRYFDTAPHSGLGRSEIRFGTALARHQRGEYLVSTRAGELVTPDGPRVDFSAAGVRRSVLESMRRLALDTIDLVFIPDPGERWQQALAEAYPALHQLREQGVVRAIGTAMPSGELLDRLVADTDLDAVLLAGQYTLFDRSGAPLVARCEAREVAVIVTGVLTDEVLSAGSISTQATATAARATERHRRVSAVCESYGISLPQAALAFPGRHSVAASVLIEAASAGAVRAAATFVRRPVPAAFWRDPILSELIDSFC